MSLDDLYQKWLNEHVYKNSPVTPNPAPAMTVSANEFVPGGTDCIFRGDMLGKLSCNCGGSPTVYACSQFERCVIPGPSKPYPLWFIPSSGEKQYLKKPDMIQVCSQCRARQDKPAVSISNPESKICVVTAYTASNRHWKEAGDIASSATGAYCDAQGYAFRCHTGGFEPSVHPSWSKIKFIKEALADHDTVLWIDGDAMVTNYNQRIEDLHTGPEEIALCTDPATVNCGVMLLRKSSFVSWMLDAVWNERGSQNRLWEQDTFTRLWREGAFSGHVAIYGPRHFNSCTPSRSTTSVNWQPGDFIAHAYATNLQVNAKIAALKEAFAKSEPYRSVRKLPQFPEITTRNLIYHAFPTKQNDVMKRNAYQLRRRLPLFNGRKIISIACDGPNCHTAAEVRDMLPRFDEYHEIPNDPKLCELASFPWLLEAIKSTDPSTATFYAHAKGNSSMPSVEGVARWRNAMYHYLLDDWKSVADALRNYTMAGCMLYDTRGTRSLHVPWVFAGTFFWFRNDAVFNHPNWSSLAQNRYGVETWPGSLFGRDQVKSLFQPWNPDQPSVDSYNPTQYGPAFDDPK